jgi:hypothetical protein
MLVTDQGGNDAVNSFNVEMRNFGIRISLHFRHRRNDGLQRRSANGASRTVVEAVELHRTTACDFDEQQTFDEHARSRSHGLSRIAF